MVTQDKAQERSPKPQSGLAAVKPYVPGKPIEEVQREYGLTDIVKLASNENPLGVSPKVQAAVIAAVCDVNQYPDSHAFDLIRALAAYLDVPPSFLHVGNGGDGLIREICVAYVDNGDEVIVGHMSFPIYDTGAAVMRGKVVKTPARNFGMDLDAMAAAITERTKIIFVCNPNNPTGTMVTAAEVDAFLARVPSHVIVVFDEAYFEFVNSSEFPNTLEYVRRGQKNILVLRTFSKIAGMAGLRLGYVAAAPELLAPLLAAGEAFPVNRLAQAAGIAALHDPEFMQQTQQMNDAGRRYLYGQCERLGLSYVVSHTNFVLVHIGPAAKAVIQSLLEQGIIVRPCTGYDLPEYARITVGTQSQNERLIAALEVGLARSRQL